MFGLNFDESAFATSPIRPSPPRAGDTPAIPASDRFPGPVSGSGVGCAG